ncbi:antitoxin MazE family protein [Synechococcus sp. HK05]|uniref:antitoxin MazE family protein n=1 Tax=Synechococcus sp. HK05 TaxID=2725975 RepID=UPI001C390ECE|nr:antitoxin MazE family protein [Synechococcus sp. HK05]MBV2352580.1 antitoxin MazE family protein [Synechococcus sp. HK05]
MVQPPSPPENRDPGPSKARLRVAAHRQRLRNQGMRPVQIWIPDTRSEFFAAAAHQQSLSASRSALANQDQAFIDSVNQLDEL